MLVPGRATGVALFKAQEFLTSFKMVSRAVCTCRHRGPKWMGRLASLKISSRIDAVMPSLRSISLSSLSSHCSTASLEDVLMLRGTCESSSCLMTCAICCILSSMSVTHIPLTPPPKRGP
uniref:Uncharacterized protein n=1 Tax=uncultured marine group II/III euryarchaeote KM3_181_C06 TaxID=1457944 RepID=A0A075GMZ7_9EURY|nr:hypothetical protein [uncultured marine group II/III euryarchaeote KM3_181_C06]